MCMYMCLWMQLGCSEWAIHAYAHHSYTAITYTRLFFYFRGIGWNGSSYTGGYKQGNRNGKGELKLVDGGREIAYYVDGKAEGAAKYYDKNGNEEDRFYKNGKLVKK